MVCLGSRMVQLVWYVLMLILFLGLGVYISYPPCVWRGKGTIVNWKVSVIAWIGFLDYVMSISILFGNFLSRMAMFNGLWVLFIMHAECELHNSKFNLIGKPRGR